ncbi:MULTISPECIES: NAD(P)H-binding protein [Nocardiopsis]|uniref:NAD(P)H-binding protein n=1 Tax=Nocardiopsis TaxID=2013 RepID=UPI00034AC021|nr:MULTISPECIES: NAD(P)H-binding protein [Nocardiopsis]PWV44258.1 putative NAD(P)-binding protein [Nocardiopsis sp. L17-MgMaSL7]
MKVFQIGAAGGVGQPLARVLTQRGDQVSGMYRRPEQVETVRASGAVPVLGDLIADTVGQLADRLAGHDAVVFSAGAHGTGTDQTSAIDGDGLKKAAQAAEQAGVRRFVLVSVFPEALRGSAEPSPGFEHYAVVKKEADAYLAARELDWVIVRPGTLTNQRGGGTVTAGPAIVYGDVAREDVAAFIAAVLAEPAVNRQIVELTSGTEPIERAVSRLADMRRA